MAGTDMPLARLLEHLDRLAQKALALWDIPANASATLINVSENATYLVKADGGFRAILRVHRESYHTRRAIECELAWINALDRDKVVVTPGHYRGRDGQAIQSCTIDGLDAPRFLVLFEFVEGAQPDETGDLTAPFEQLGAMAARMHLHAMGWPRPDRFERLVWDDAAVFGPRATWGNWRDAPNVDGSVRPVLEAAEKAIRARLATYGKGRERYGLIHADAVRENVLVQDGAVALIDFDDCGYGFRLFDLATALHPNRTEPAFAEIEAALLEGYRSQRPLPAAAEAALGLFALLRAFTYVGWIMARADAPEAEARSRRFIDRACALARNWA